MVDKIKTDYFLKLLKNEPKYSMSRVNIIDSVIKYSSDKKNLLKLQGMKADALYDIGNYDLALPLYEKIYNKSGVDNVSTEHLLDNLGSCYYFTGHYDRAILLAHEQLERNKPDSLLYYNANAYNAIASVYIRMMNAEAAEKYLEEEKKLLDASDKVSNQKRNIQLRRYWLVHSAVHLLRNNYEKAYGDLEKAGSIAGDNLTDLLLDINMAIVYGQMGEYKLAEEFYKRIEAFPFSHYNKLLGLNNYAVFKLYSGDFEGALKLTEENLREVKHLKFNHLLSQIYQIRSAVYLQLNDYKNAYLTLDSSRMLTDSLFSTQALRNILSTNEEYAASLSEREHSRRKVIEQAKALTIGVLVILLATAVGAFLFVWKRWKKTGRQAEEVKSENARIGSELGRMEKEVISERQKYSECVMELCKQREELQAELIRLAGAGVAEKNLCRLRRLVDEGEKRKLQLRQLEDDNKEFVLRLTEAHPNLTHGEIRMAIYIVMGKTSREIAGMINRSVRTVETVRYHLGRKVGSASGSMAIADYLARFNKKIES